jgi:lactate dehydrogenase-like 2-hydroxyacid dehydrogenase
MAKGARPTLLMTGAYPQWDMEALAHDYEVLRLFEAKDPQALIAAHAESIRAIATRGDLGAGADLMRRLPGLEIVTVFGVGTDAVDFAHARSRNIKITNTPDVLTGDVADLAVALLLAAARLVPQGDRLVRSGNWPKGGLPLVTRVHGKKAGIVGMGRIGSAVAKRLSGFDCEISYFARSEKSGSPHRFEPDLIALARDSEFLIVTLSGGEGTKDMIAASVFAALGPDGIFVNVSRGSTVDEAALIAAVQNKTIKAAGLDVFWNEPDINPTFFALDNIVLQPHHASGTVETRRAMGELVRGNLAAHFAGRPLLTPVD